jgi:hypothetical protein
MTDNTVQTPQNYAAVPWSDLPSLRELKPVSVGKKKYT